MWWSFATFTSKVALGPVKLPIRVRFLGFSTSLYKAGCYQKVTVSKDCTGHCWKLSSDTNPKRLSTYFWTRFALKLDKEIGAGLRYGSLQQLQITEEQGH